MDLVSIAPATKTVALGGAAVVVKGLSLRKLMPLNEAFPGLLVFTDDKVALGQLTPDTALGMFSLGVVGRARAPWWQRKVARITDADDDLVEVFDAAAAGQQADALNAIFDLTFHGSDRALPFLRAALAARAPDGAVLKPPEAPTPSPETPAESLPVSSSG